MLLVCNYYPGIDQGGYPYEDGLTSNLCTRCQQWDVKVCEENVCKGGKSRDWLASGMVNDTIDQCSDGLGRIMDPCTTVDPTKAPSEGISLSPTKVTASPTTSSPSRSTTLSPTQYTKTPTSSPTMFGTIVDDSRVKAGTFQYNSETVFVILSISIGIIAIIVTIIGIIDAKCIKYNELFRAMMVIMPFAYLYVRNIYTCICTSIII